jgi:hypothetical protein
MLRSLFAGIITSIRLAFSNCDGSPRARQEVAHDARLAWVFELSLFLLLAVASTWPLGSRIGSAIPKGTERVATVPLFNQWTIWWNADRAGRMFDGYWNAPIFAPSDHSFALSEAQPTTVLVAPVVWISGSRTLGYNAYLLCMLTLNGWSGCLLLRSLTGSRLVGIWAGAALLLLPFVHWQLGVLQLTALSGVLLTLHFLFRFVNDLRLKDAALAGVSIGFCYLSCNYYGYQLCLVLLLSSMVFLLPRISSRKLVIGAAIAAFVAGVIVAPVVGVQLSVSGGQSWDRKLNTVCQLSASVNDYLRSNWRGPLAGSTFTNQRFPLSPGASCLVLAAVGSVTGLRVRETRKLSIFVLMFLLMALFLSRGPTLAVGGQVPFLHLAEWLPGLNAMRSPYRFAVLVQVSCIVLAGMSFARSNCTANSVATTDIEDIVENVHMAPQMSPPTKWRHVTHWGRSVLLCGILIESWPANPDMYSMPEYDQQRPWIEWLQAETPPDDIVANLPFPSGRSASDYQDTTIAMLWSTYHNRRLANGYSGFFPKEFVQLKSDVQNFPDDKSVRELRKSRVRWCVVNTDELKSANVDKLTDQSQLSLRFETDDRKTRIYEVKPVEEFNWKFE